MNVTECINKLNLITNDTYLNIETFSNSLEEIVAIVPMEKCDDLKECSLLDKYHKVHHQIVKRIGDSQKAVDRNSDILKQKQLDVQEIDNKLSESKLLNECTQKDVQRLKEECELYQRKSQNLDNLKKCIKSYKLLTGTHFAYQKGATAGYIRMENGSKYEVFDFNHSQVGEQDITRKLWAILENVSK